MASISIPFVLVRELHSAICLCSFKIRRIFKACTQKKLGKLRPLEFSVHPLPEKASSGLAAFLVLRSAAQTLKLQPLICAIATRMQLLRLGDEICTASSADAKSNLVLSSASQLSSHCKRNGFLVSMTVLWVVGCTPRQCRGPVQKLQQHVP